MVRYSLFVLEVLLITEQTNKQIDIRWWMCDLIERKDEQWWEFLRLEPVSMVIKKDKLRWFGHVEHKDDIDWVKRCMMMEVEQDRGVIQGRL